MHFSLPNNIISNVIVIELFGAGKKNWFDLVLDLSDAKKQKKVEPRFLPYPLLALNTRLTVFNPIFTICTTCVVKLVIDVLSICSWFVCLCGFWSCSV